MPIISISRRTDIPAFYSAWLLNRLRAGFCHVANPFTGKVSRVSLRPEDCLALVFWTRHPAALLPHLDFLRASGYKHYTQVTINGYPRVLEPHAPSVDEAVAGFRRLAAATAPEFMAWRYDPIVLSELTSAEDHLRCFEQLARALAGATRRCITSFVDLYSKTQRNLTRLSQAHGIHWQDPAIEERRQLLHAMADIAEAQGIQLHLCCEKELVDDRVRQAHCIDPELIRQLCPEESGSRRPAPSRAGCGCAESVDIGAYDLCGYGCAYCYATNSVTAARRRCQEHDPEDTILWRPPLLRGTEL